MMRIMALDAGDRNIGVAVSDELGWTAQGLTVIRRGTWEEDLARLRTLVVDYQVSRIVVGHPRNMDGSSGTRAILSAEFADRLSADLGLPTVLWDERLTTREAQAALLLADLSRAKRRRLVDKLAAVLILQNYLAANPISITDSGKQP
jgi:putative Holliday junction resolvase